MEVKIGVQNAPREISVDVDDDVDGIEKQVRAALESDDGVLALTDHRGRRVVVPAAKLAYVEVSATAAGQVGFRS